jgi:C-terminal processing protease CtpA/Prc
MDDGSALILTVANYYTPGNKEIPTTGVVPTEVIHPVLDDATPAVQDLPVPSSSISDPVVKKAVEILQTSGSQKKAA